MINKETPEQFVASVFEALSWAFGGKSQFDDGIFIRAINGHYRNQWLHLDKGDVARAAVLLMEDEWGYNDDSEDTYEEFLAVLEPYKDGPSVSIPRW